MLKVGRAALACAVVLLTAACASQPNQATAPSAPPGVGAAAPAFTLQAARGGQVAFDPVGQPTLLSFISARPHTDETKPDPSRGQIVFLKSMAEQYTERGLRVVLIESAVGPQGERVAGAELLNFSYDWALEATPLLADTREAATARAYGVSQLPTTFLIAANGTIAQRWDGFASSAQLALAVQALLDAPAAARAAGCAETPPRTPFAGFGPARPLSERIWLIDGGKGWTSGASHPTTWLVLGDAQAPTLRVSTGTTSQPLFEAALERLPDDEARPLLAQAPASSTNVYQLTLPVSLDTAGCVTLRAEVMDGSTLLGRGEVVIDVR